ncbi:hypothetical protein PMALA_074890 [Plasmodium malariae]|uniref:Uncharacterized protein n=1 Tax=Plasmodium malariae TaxID=5858 RepID=A0A1A8X6M4_PLAMA|nr:hypothetical protein PMALA_074890 [Plasmodium malariae]
MAPKWDNCKSLWLTKKLYDALPSNNKTNGNDIRAEIIVINAYIFEAFKFSPNTDFCAIIFFANIDLIDEPKLEIVAQQNDNQVKCNSFIDAHITPPTIINKEIYLLNFKYCFSNIIDNTAVNTGSHALTTCVKDTVVEDIDITAPK